MGLRRQPDTAAGHPGDWETMACDGQKCHCHYPYVCIDCGCIHNDEAEARSGALDDIFNAHTRCGPKYTGCYSHWPMPHCRADGMAWPCDVEDIRARLRAEERRLLPDGRPDEARER